MKPFLAASISAAFGLFLLAAWLLGTALYFVGFQLASLVIVSFVPFGFVYKICMEAVVGHFLELEMEGLEDDAESVSARQSFVYSDELQRSRAMP